MQERTTRIATPIKSEDLKNSNIRERSCNCKRRMKTISICCVLTAVLLTMTRALAFQLPFTRTVTAADAAAAKKAQLRDNSSSIKPGNFPSLEPQAYKQHRSNVTKENKKNKRILALLTTCSTLPAMLLRPKAATAAAAAATSSILTTPQKLVVDPALLTSTAGEEFGAVSVAFGTSNNFVQTFVTTTMATIQMKQRSMIMFALALGMVATLLKCAEGGYVKLIEFMIDRCLLGYYGVGVSTTKNDDVDRKVGWDEYMSQYLPKRRGSVVGGKKNEEFVLDKQTMLFHSVAGARDDDTMMKKATQTYREKQYEQHNHLVHVDKGSSANTASSSSRKYLDTLSKFSTSPLNRHHLDNDTYLDSLSQHNTFMTPNSRTSSWSGYKNALHSMILNQAEHNETSSKLQIMKNLLTWEDYKHLVTELQMKKEECTKLEEEVTTLKKLLQEADGSGSSTSSNDDELELKILEDKAKEYDETVKESKVNEDSVRWH